MSKETEILDGLHDAILDLDKDAAVSLAEELVKTGGDPLKAIDSMGTAMNELGVKFEKMEVFLPEVVIASKALKAAMVILKPEILKQGEETGAAERPVVVIGTVKGDIHTIGKDMVATLLMTAGFEVVDMGPDTPPSDFLNKAEELGATIIAATAMMSTTLPIQKDLVDFLDAKKLRDKYSVMVGGGVASQGWAESINADGYGQDAIEAVKVAKNLASKKK